jgi:hypothetical protein
MKKLIIPFAAAFGLSLGLATGVVVMRAPKLGAAPAIAKPVAPRPKPDSIKVVKDSALSPSDTSAAVAGQTPPNADSGATKAVTATPQPANTAANTVASLVSAKPSSTPIVSTKKGPPTVAQKNSPAVVAKSTAAAGPVVKPVAATARPVSDSLIGRRLAQVFAAMQAKDAARVLEQMDDADVRAILVSLSSKQQAAILGSFPTQRAATILQATLRTASTGGTE